MQLKIFLSFVVVVVLILFSDHKKDISIQPLSSSTLPPVAEKIPHTIQLHGKDWNDEYYWLRERESEKVLDYLKAENAYTSEQLKHTEEFQKNLYEEILSRIKQTDQEVPYPYGKYFYYSRTEEKKQYSIRCRKFESLDAPEQIILDENALAEGHEYSSLGIFSVSPDQKLLAYSHDTKGNEKYTIYVKNLETGELFSDVIKNTSYAFEWGNDNKTFFYTVLDKSQRPFKVFRHQLGIEEDVEIYHEKDEKFYLDVEKSEDEKFLYISSNSATTTEVRFLDADKPTGEWQIFIPRQQGVELSVYHQNDKFLIVTNEDGAKNFKLMEVAENEMEHEVAESEIKPGTRENWKLVEPYDPLVKLDSVTPFKDFLVIWERRNGLSSMRVKRLSDGSVTQVQFDETVYVVKRSVNANYDTHFVRISYQSLVTPKTSFQCLVTPKSTYDYNMVENTRQLLKQEPVLGNYDKTEYESKSLFATAIDGAKIPISLVYKKSLFKQDGTKPFLLYGYGSYGYTVEPTFNSNRLSLLDRGVSYAIAHIRGGGAMGRPWYDAGKLMVKKTTFTDFITCAEFLFTEKYTSRDRLAAMGASAGGLLMGAVLTMSPQSFHSVVADVPFLDVINTMLDEELPLTVGEFEEWGNPKEKDFFDYMVSYSPYDNIKPQEYPQVLCIGAFNDPRVQYWEPAKFVARMRATKVGNNRLLLKTFMEEGHAGASGRYDSLKETAFTYAFILDSLGFK